jgi:hypothetical protein
VILGFVNLLYARHVLLVQQLSVNMLHLPSIGNYLLWDKL